MAIGILGSVVKANSEQPASCPQECMLQLAQLQQASMNLDAFSDDKKRISTRIVTLMGLSSTYSAVKIESMKALGHRLPELASKSISEIAVTSNLEEVHSEAVNILGFKTDQYRYAHDDLIKINLEAMKKVTQGQSKALKEKAAEILDDVGKRSKTIFSKENPLFLEAGNQVRQL